MCIGFNETSYHARDVNKWFRPMFDPRAMERSAEWEGKAVLQPPCTWGDKIKGSEISKNVNKRGYFMLSNLSYSNLKNFHFKNVWPFFGKFFWPVLLFIQEPWLTISYSYTILNKVKNRKFVLNWIFNYHFWLLNQVVFSEIFQKLRHSSAAYFGDQPWLAENHRLKKSKNQDKLLVLTDTFL